MRFNLFQFNRVLCVLNEMYGLILGRVLFVLNRLLCRDRADSERVQFTSYLANTTLVGQARRHWMLQLPQERTLQERL